ncbi:MAG: hypothetical protein B6242_09695 [Anaerolineaceae bacterium 4572_78]|nr:MAG: hypothetical protein B6242_09695 [Anaerolineaceae bacterium 4572_78]
MSMEIEAKFVLDDPDIFQQLKTSQTLAGYTISTGKIKNVHDYYFDTSERLILQAGYACRIRDDGKKIKFTLKGLNKGKGIIHRREELEIELPDKLWSDKTWSVKACFDMSNKDLSLNDLPAGEIRDSFLQITHGDDLHLLFGLTQKRFVRIITDADRVVAEFSLDDVHVSVDEVNLGGFYENAISGYGSVFGTKRYLE